MTPDALLRALGTGRAAPVYFFPGPDGRLKRTAIDALVATVPEALRAFNIQVFHAFEADLSEVLTAARTLPFLGSRRVVVLRDVEKLAPAQGRSSQLEDYLLSPAPETVLVVTTEDEEKAKSLSKRHGDRWTVVAFKPLQGAALAKAVAAEAVRLGCSIEPGAVAALIETTGADRDRLFNELDKLRSAVGPGGVVDRPAVERYASGYAHHGSNKIAEAISRRDLRGALSLLHRIPLKDEDFLPLLGMVGKRLRVLWYMATPPQPVPKVFNVEYKLAELRADARRFSRAEIEAGLHGLGRLDEALKSTAVPPRLLLERFLLDFLPTNGPGR